MPTVVPLRAQQHTHPTHAQSQTLMPSTVPIVAHRNALGPVWQCREDWEEMSVPVVGWLVLHLVVPHQKVVAAQQLSNLQKSNKNKNQPATRIMRTTQPPKSGRAKYIRPDRCACTNPGHPA